MAGKSERRICRQTNQKKRNIKAIEKGKPKRNQRKQERKRRSSRGEDRAGKGGQRR
jgi:hypothetical protein